MSMGEEELKRLLANAANSKSEPFDLEFAAKHPQFPNLLSDSYFYEEDEDD